MLIVREIMSSGAASVRTDDSLVVAARTMRETDVGAVPVLTADGAIVGVVTDRDIVVRCVADGVDPSTMQAGDLADDAAVTVNADDLVDAAVTIMKAHKIRRLPVVDDGRLVGIVSQADLARSLPDHVVGDLVDALSS